MDTKYMIMCSYDYMTVELQPPVSQHNQITTIKPLKQVKHLKCSTFHTVFGSLKVWFLVILLLHPVYGSPLRRLIQNPRHIRHPHRNNNRIGIGVETTRSQVDTHNTVSPWELSESSQPVTKLSFASSTENLHFSTLNPLVHSTPQSTSTAHSRRRSPLEMDDADRAVGRSRRASAGCDGNPSVDPVVGGSWQEPCRNLNLVKEGGATSSELSLHIMKGVVEANSQVESFIDSFSLEAFDVPWKDATEHNGYALEFLNTSSDIDLTNPSAISFEDALKEAYELMQRRAVGIEQVTLDQALYQSTCLSRFRQLERHIIHILCQLRHAMISKSVTPRDNVTKDIMEENTRTMESEQSRNIRDAIILREYIKSLHTLHSVFNHFHQQSS